MLDDALADAETVLAATLRKGRFWEGVADLSINDQQRTILNRLLNGFEGKLTTTKWARITKCSQDTALRDITALISQGVLVQDPAGGRSSSYSLRAD